jgi:hypothetical protein
MMLKTLEISWVLLALLSLGVGIYKWLTEGFIFAIWFFLCAIISTIVWLVRRNQRLRLENKRRQ